MSANGFNPTVGTQPDFKTRARQLGEDSLAILKVFDPIALGLGIVLAVLLGLLGIPWIVAALLGAMTYAGVTLLRPHSAPAPPPPPIPEPESAYELGRHSCARIQLLTKEIVDPAVRRQVRTVTAKFTRMLDVMDEDQKFDSTSDYYSMLVYPFERMLREYVRLSSRNVPGASRQLAYFAGDIVPRTEAVAEAAYQDYHQVDVIDFAALMEIHRLNLDTLNPDDDDADSDETHRLVATPPLDDDIEPHLDGEERKSI